jgi:signal transduction histidine kinase
MKPRILVVDDDDVVRDSLMDELAGSYEVETATCGEEAVACLGQQRYDAVISDFRMPDMDGIQVLEAARQQNGEVVRILLTGYLDERARGATLAPDAPFKIGKPWHEEIEVTLRRAFEQRDARQRLSRSLGEALAVSNIDEELGRSDGLVELGRVLVSRAARIPDVHQCAVLLDAAGTRRLLAGELPAAQRRADDWQLDSPLTPDGSTRLLATGSGAGARSICAFLAERARRWLAQDLATRLTRQAATSETGREQLQRYSRQALLGAMATSLVHDMAGLIQTMQGAFYEVEAFVREQSEDPELIDSLDALGESTSRMVTLFRAMRTFVRSGDIGHRPCRVDELVMRAQTLCQSYVESRAVLHIGELPEVEIEVNEPLFLQVLVNLVSNAVDASPAGGRIDLDVQVADGQVSFAVTDDGPGVSDEMLGQLFDPFVTSKLEQFGSGLGLALAAQIVHNLDGTIRYERAPGRGARFIVSVRAGRC